MNPAITKIAPDLFFIRRGWLCANHLVASGERPQLMDTGYLQNLSETLELIQETGVDPARVKRIITTHIHCDHVGGHAHIHQLSGCAIALHPLCRHAIDHQDGLAAWYAYYGQAHRFFPTHESIEDGDLIAFGGLEWQAIHAPGHGAGQLCFFAPENGWLISADAVWQTDFGVLTVRIEGWDAPFRQAQSLARLARLRVTRIFPGHGPIIKDAQAAIQACQERAAAFIQKPVRIGEDQIRKILLYQVMMNAPISRKALWEIVTRLPWFPETCEAFFDGEQKKTFDRFMDELQARELICVDGELLSCTLPA